MAILLQRLVDDFFQLCRYFWVQPHRRSGRVKDGVQRRPIGTRASEFTFESTTDVLGFGLLEDGHVRVGIFP